MRPVCVRSNVVAYCLYTGPMAGMEPPARGYHGQPVMNMGYAPGGYGDQHQGGADSYYYEAQGGGPGGHTSYDPSGYQEGYQDRGYHPSPTGAYGLGGGYQRHRR